MFDSFNGAEFIELRIFKLCPMITPDSYGNIFFSLELCAKFFENIKSI